MQLHQRYKWHFLINLKCLFFMVLFISITTVDGQVNCTGLLGAPVVNITFGSGNINPGSELSVAVPGASTTYNFASYATGHPPVPPNDGDYALVTEVPGNGAWYSGSKDHTGDLNGYMAFFNASPTSGEFYKQNVRKLTAGTTYEFAAWVANVINPAVLSTAILPNITFQILDSTSKAILGSYNTGDIHDSTLMKWRQYKLSFTMPAGLTTITLKLINNNVGGAQQPGNDLAIDDITLRPCPAAFTQCGSSNLLTNPSFESPVVPVLNGNNIMGSTWSDWQCNPGINVIKVNGTPYDSGSDTAADGNQYLDVNGAAGYISQIFKLPTASKINFRGYFSNRETNYSWYRSWSGFIQIVDSTNAVVATSDTLDFTKALGDETWYYASGSSSIILPAGNYTYRAFTGDDGHFDNATVCLNIPTKKNQTIKFNPIPNITYNDTFFIVRAVASSGLPVTYSIISGPGAIKGDTLTVTGAGPIQVRATQRGNDTLNAAFADVTFTVKKAAATVILSNLTKIYNGSPQSPTVTTNPAGLLVAFAFDSSSTPPVNAGSYHVIATIDDINYTGSDTGTFVIKSISAPDLSVQNVTADSTIIAPGDMIKVSWKVANLGTGKLYVNWTEKIYMQSAAGENRTLLKQSNFIKNDSISTGQTITRNVGINIPSQLNIGDKGVFVVEIIPGSSIHEEQGNEANNTGIQKTPWAIKKLLTVGLSNSEITEGSSDKITITVNRTGSLSSPLTVNVNLSHPNRFSFPSSVTIAAGQAGSSFTISSPDNSTIEGTIKDTVRITATNFTAAKANLTILDNDKASLSISNLPLKAMEGETISFQVTTSLAPAAPLQVFLTSDNQARFPVPSSVTIPAGSLFATVTVILNQDNLPEVDQAVTITAGASNQNSGSAAIEVNDDDIPGLELVVQTNLISESAGLYATQATLRRTAKSNSIAFTANLSADLYNTIILPDNISLAAGESEKSFTIGVVDNNKVDGQRRVAITASIFVASCGCSAPPASSGSVSAGITVSDNDGPSIQLTTEKQTFAEGLSKAGFLRVTRNTATNDTLAVNISSSNPKEATIPATASIPAGKTFIDVPFTTINDGKADGNKQVYFQASAKGYSPGSVSILVTDLNKPDLQIPAVKLPDNNIQAGGLFNYQLSVKNTGFATAPAGVRVLGYLSLDSVIDNSDTVISEDTVSGAITTGQTVQVLNAVKAPNLPGKYKLLFRVNPDTSLSELLVMNNTSTSVNLTIKPDYTATASVALPYFIKGTTITITGSTLRSDSTPAANVQVEVYVITDGLRRKYLVTTDRAGHYTAQFVPLAKEVGHYIVGASFPGVDATTEQDAFDILGVRINEGNIPQFRVSLNDTLKGSLSIQNMSNKSLTNFTLTPVSLPGGAHIRFDTIQVLKGNTTINLSYRVTGSSLSPGGNFDVADLQAIAKEGSIQKAEVFYFCQAPNAYVVADISKIDISVSQSKGERQVQFTLVNKGIGLTGNISINLPKVNWISSVTPLTLPSMAAGDTTIVVLKFLASTEVPFNYPIDGSIGIGTQNGNSFSIPFTFQKVSQTTGAINVTVTNQFTYFAEGSPKVKGAHVQIKNYFSGKVYAEGFTDSAGVFAAKGIPEGQHRIIVEKDKHLPYENTITIDPGDTVATAVFLDYQAVTFSWSVVPTAVQDKYDITLETHFETNLPMPVVTIEVPKAIPELGDNEVFEFMATLTNHGLITAKDVTLELPQNDAQYEFVTNYIPADLLPQQSIQVPVRVRKLAGKIGVSTSGSSGTSIASISRFLGITEPQAATGATPNCLTFIRAIYWYKCNFNTGLWERVGAIIEYRACIGKIDGSIDENNASAPCAKCPPLPNWGKGGAAPPNPFTKEKKNCKECLIDLAKAILGCVGVDVPDIPPAAGCAMDSSKNKSLEDLQECLMKELNQAAKDNIQDKLEDVIGEKLPYIRQLICLREIIRALLECLKSIQDSHMNLVSANQELSSSSNVLQKIYDDLQVVATSYDLHIKWDNEYFKDLSLSDSWIKFYPLISTYVDSLDTIPGNIQTNILTSMAGYEMKASDIKFFFNRWNTSIKARNQDILAPNSQYPDIINWKLVKAWSDSMVDAHNYAISNGYHSISDMHSKSRASLDTILDNQKNEVCASVTVQFSQQLTMTREAFEGTLEIFNGHPTDAMDSLSVNINITDENGVPSNGLFQTQTKGLTNLANVTGTGKIASQQKGSVTFLFIPEVLAAPTKSKVYNFGGSVHYWDPYAKAMVTFPLASVPITVNPSPNLMLHYFMQRNILGDDALTKPDIEPSVPAELAVMVENQGYGSAVNMTISSAQPKIVDNEKGLAVNFNVIGSNFQGKPANLGVTNINFGTIPGMQTRIGQWYFTSALLGKFVSYQASVVHANSFGNPALSLVKGIKLHELTKSIRVYGKSEDGINDFLVNDIFDVHDVPDMLYYSQGNRTEKVYPAATGSFSSLVSPPAFTDTLRVTASKTGWNYIKLGDPGNRQYDIVSVTRSDGQIIPLDNAWLTFVTLPVSQAPVYENQFHFVDSFASLTPVKYTVVWKPRSFDVPKVLSIEGAPEQVTAVQVKKLRVVFNKSINPKTFTDKDLVLTFQGSSNLSDTSIVITRVDTATFDVDLSKITTGNGFYALTVQAANVTDVYGKHGLSGKQVTWSQFLDVPIVQAFQGIPESKTASAFDKIQVLFNLPINVSSVTPNRFTVSKDSILQQGTITIDSVRADKKLFYLSGLKNILIQSGTYKFIVDLPKIKSVNNVPGVQKQSATLKVDKSIPLVLSLKKSNAGGLDLQHITSVNIKFSEEVAGFNTASVQLTRNGEVLPLNIDQLSSQDLTSWIAGRFGLLTYPEGDYVFKINLATVKDAAGNKGTGSKQVSWTVSRSTMITITQMTITPDLGFSDTDRVTSGDSLNVAFHLSGNASQVTISQVYLSGETVLKNISNVAAGDKSLRVTLITGGNTVIKVTATGVNGGVVTTEKALFDDQVALSAAWLFASKQSLTRQVDTIPIVFSERLLSNKGFLSAIQFRRNGVKVPTDSIHFKAVNDTVYSIYGLSKASSLPGNYELGLNLETLHKYSSGKKGSGLVSAMWTVQSNNQAPIAKAGNDFTITAAGTYNLNGSASSDPDADSITYRWIAPTGIMLSNSASATPSFNITAASQDSSYSFLLIVSDGALFTTDVIDVKVRVVAANKAPVVSLTSPAVNSLYRAPATITIKAAASDADGTISFVKFYNRSTLLNIDSTSPYTYTMTNVAAGNYSFLATATDDEGLTGLAASVAVTVSEINKAPVVSITSPANNTVYTAPATFTINADATDADGISRVEFYRGRILLNIDSVSPYTYTMTNVAAGHYSFVAQATDNKGLSSSSSYIVVAVSVEANNAPVISLTTPAVNSIYRAPATITIKAAASDADGTISVVKFYNGSQLLNIDSTSPYTYTMTNVAAGDYKFLATATDDKGLTGLAASVAVTVAEINKAPVVSITSPANNTVYTAPATFTINANATDADGISKVDFYNAKNGILLGTDSTSPYNYTLANVAVGNYSFVVHAIDKKGRGSSSSGIAVLVEENKAPIVSITSPLNNATYTEPATISIDALASDPDGTIYSVKFYNGTTYLRTVFTSPYTYTLSNLPAGTYSLTAKATDNNGAQTISAVATVIVKALNKAPTVSITTPSNNATYTAPATISINALASDQDGTIYSVKFYNGTTYLKTVFTSPYTYTLSNLPAGTYSLTAKATDNNGAQTISAPINITVTSNPLIVSNKQSLANKVIGVKDALSMQLTPNPAGNIVNIYTTGLQREKHITISIISVSGIVLKTIQTGNLTQILPLDVSSLVKGVYTIKVISGDKMMYKQFVKL